MFGIQNSHMLFHDDTFLLASAISLYFVLQSASRVAEAGLGGMSSVERISSPPAARQKSPLKPLCLI
jgi:hypothetical protein